MILKVFSWKLSKMIGNQILNDSRAIVLSQRAPSWANMRHREPPWATLTHGETLWGSEPRCVGAKRLATMSHGEPQRAAWSHRESRRLSWLLARWRAIANHQVQWSRITTYHHVVRRFQYTMSHCDRPWFYGCNALVSIRSRWIEPRTCSGIFTRTVKLIA